MSEKNENLLNQYRMPLLSIVLRVCGKVQVINLSATCSHHGSQEIPQDTLYMWIWKRE